MMVHGAFLTGEKKGEDYKKEESDMNKKIIIFVAAIILILSSADTVFAEDVSINVEEVSSLQQLFTKLQLELAQQSKANAESYIQQIEELQKEQQQSIQFLTNARQLRSQAESLGQGTEMPDDMAAYMDARNLHYDKTGNDLLMDAFEWTEAIDSLEMYQVAVSTKVQQAMIDLQTSGVHGTYLAEANGRIAWSHEMLMGIARGQSMYGTSEAGLAVTGLVLGLVLGCVVTLGVQKLCRKNKQY